MPEENFWIFMVQGKTNRGRHTDNPAGRHSIQTNQCQPPPSPTFITGRMPFLQPTNSVKALKANKTNLTNEQILCTGLLYGNACHVTSRWQSGTVVTALIKNVTLCQVWLVPRWVNICMYTILACNQPLRPTQPPTPVGWETSTGQSAAILSSCEVMQIQLISLWIINKMCVWQVKPCDGSLTCAIPECLTEQYHT